MKLTVESEVSSKIPTEIIILLTEIAKKFDVDVWVTKANEDADELEDLGYGHAV